MADDERPESGPDTPGRVVWRSGRPPQVLRETPLDHKQEHFRQRLGGWILVFMGCIVGAVFVLLGFHRISVDDARSLLAVLFTPLVVLLTGITNWYMPGKH